MGCGGPAQGSSILMSNSAGPFCLPPLRFSSCSPIHLDHLSFSTIVSSQIKTHPDNFFPTCLTFAASVSKLGVSDRVA